LLPADDRTTAVDNCRRVVTRQWNGKLFCNALAIIIALENVALSQQMEFYLLFPAIFVCVWCSRGTSTWSLLPCT